MMKSAVLQEYFFLSAGLRLPILGSRHFPLAKRPAAIYSQFENTDLSVIGGSKE